MGQSTLSSKSPSIGHPVVVLVRIDSLPEHEGSNDPKSGRASERGQSAEARGSQRLFMFRMARVRRREGGTENDGTCQDLYGAMQTNRGIGDTRKCLQKRLGRKHGRRARASAASGNALGLSACRPVGQMTSSLVAARSLAPLAGSAPTGCMGWAKRPMCSFEIKALRHWPPDFVAVVDRLVYPKKSK